MKMNNQDNFFQLIERIIFITLSIASIFIGREVLWKFQSLDSSFKTTEIPITNKPTIAICLPYQFQNYTYGTDFNISMYFFLNDYTNKKNEFILKEGENLLDQKITLTKIYTVHYGPCYVIVSKNIGKKLGFTQVIKVSVKENVSENQLPQLQIYFTSEDNFHGIVGAFWMDGEILSFQMNTQQRYMAIGIKEEKYQRLKDKSPCRDEPYFSCYGSRYVKSSFEECPKKCLAHSVPKSVALEKDIPICETKSEAWNCSFKVGIRLIRTLQANATCLERSCTLVQYDGKVVFEESHPESPLVHPNSRSFSYSFMRTSVAIHEEYLIYDFIGMLGSIGGTLGMCIGFSFVSLSSVLLFYLQTLIVYLKY